MSSKEVYSVQQTLYALIELQEVDNRLDELMEERGDLPLIVKELDTKTREKQKELTASRAQLKQTKIQQREFELQIQDSRNRLSKYEDLLYKVKTNKEYDALMAETDQAKEKLKQCENDLISNSDTMEKTEERITELEAEVSKLEHELAENKVELQSKLNETAEEENLLNQERSIILKKSSPEIIKTYELVRNARDGQGIASVERGVCGGCFSYIPPQKIVEIKKMKLIYTCESCGRILVWDDSRK
jgi:predicted  nucleic acid-binding Zn-ribbon protein